MSDPNCRRRVSECIFLDALSRAPARPLADGSAAAPPGAVSVSGESDEEAWLLVRLTTGDRGISCSCGWGWKPVMQSMTSTLAAALVEAGVRLGRYAAEE